MVFVLRSLRHPAPIVDLGLLRIRTVLRANLAMLLAGLVMFAVPFGTVLFLIGVWGYSAARAGLAVTPGPVIQVAAALFAGRLTNRLGPRSVAVPGAALLAVSTLIFAAGAHAQPRYLAVILPATLASGAGLGLMITSLSSVIVSEIPQERLASGTAISVTARAVGAIVSLSAFALLLAATPGGTRAPAGFHTAWVAMSVIAIVLIGVVWTVRPAARVAEVPA